MIVAASCKGALFPGSSQHFASTSPHSFFPTGNANMLLARFFFFSFARCSSFFTQHDGASMFMYSPRKYNVEAHE